MSVLMVLVLFFLPLFVERAFAQVAEAQAQAEKDVNGTLWLGVGCLLGLVGYLIALLVVPNPPAGALMGKSPDYVVQYTDAYKSKAKSMQTSKALIGCLVGTGLQILVYVLAFASSSTS